jgi:hypothetical protein
VSSFDFASASPMADNDNVRQRIIASVFNRRNAAGQQETYVGHLKIWEDAEDGVKPRYIILSRMLLCMSSHRVMNALLSQMQIMFLASFTSQS